MKQAILVFMLFFTVSFSPSLSAQETQATSVQEAPPGAVLILGVTDREQTFQVEVRTASGEVFACPQLVSARRLCRLEGVPPGKVTVQGKIGEKQMKPLSLNLPSVGAEVSLEHKSYGPLITVGVILALSVAALVIEIVDKNVNAIIEDSVVLAGAATVFSIGLIKGRDSLKSNGKDVKKNGTIRASLSPNISKPAEQDAPPSLGLGIRLTF
jgi:hypothetical protein